MDVGIFQNDTALDIKGQVDKATEKDLKKAKFWKDLIKTYVVALNYDGRIFKDHEGMLAIAALQLEHNCLQEDIKNKAIKIIDTGEYTNFSTWMYKEDIPPRKAVLAELKEKLLNAEKTFISNDWKNSELGYYSNHMTLNHNNLTMPKYIITKKPKKSGWSVSSYDENQKVYIPDDTKSDRSHVVL